MASCQDIELRLVELLREDPPKDLLIHLKDCPECGEKQQQWARLWNLMDRWEEEKPSNETIEPILSLVRGDLKREAAQRQRPVSTPSEAKVKAGSVWWASGIGVVLFSAIIASLLSIGSSIALGYGKAIQLSMRSLQALGLAGSLPEGAIFFVVGCLYSLLPLLLVGLIFGRIADGHRHRLRLSFWVVAIFLLVTLPYTVVECRNFSVGLALSLLAGVTAGAVIGSLGGFYLSGRKAALA